MIFSVYNYGTRGFDYFDAPVKPTAHAGTPPSGTPNSSVTPEAAAWRVPAGARLVGSGPAPRGRVASRGEISLAGFDSTTNLIAVGVIAYFAWTIFKK